MTIAATWTEFAEDQFTRLDGRLRMAARAWQSLFKAAPPFVPADVLWGASVLLAELVAARGVAASRPHIEPFLPKLPEAFLSVPVGTKDGYETVEGVLWFDNLIETLGFGAERPPHAEWLAAMARQDAGFGSRTRQSFAFVSLAYGEYDRIPDFLGLPLPDRFTPGTTFQFDYPRMLLHLGAACRDQVAFDAVEPAWLDFLRSFPFKLGAEAVQWPHLFCVGRAVYQRIQGLPAGEVARETHKQIMQLIAQGH